MSTTKAPPVGRQPVKRCSNYLLRLLFATLLNFLVQSRCCISAAASFSVSLTAALTTGRPTSMTCGSIARVSVTDGQICWEIHKKKCDSNYLVCLFVCCLATWATSYDVSIIISTWMSEGSGWCRWGNLGGKSPGCGGGSGVVLRLCCRRTSR